MFKVLITGITGFIGSKVAEVLCQNQVEVIGLKRENSDTWRCKKFFSDVDWIDIEGDWKEFVAAKGPNIIIHSAWIGVESTERDDYGQQGKNIIFLTDLLSVCQKIKIDKFIFLGSQSEYGNIEGKVGENQIVHPVNAYAAIKIASLEILKTFCITSNINWVWLRIFSVFGEKEGDHWLIPSLIKTMQVSKEMDFTLGEQRYAYMYISDLADIIYQIVIKQVQPGIYNISASETMILKTLIEKIRDMVNKDFVLNFGSIPYRNNQSMHIEGDISKLVKQIGSIQFTNFNVALQNTINYYINRIQ